MNISYESLGAKITETQANQARSFTKIYTIPEGNIKIEEEYMDGELITISYYRDSNETEEQAIEALSGYNASYAIITRESFNTYEIQNLNFYLADGNLNRRYKYLLNSDNEIVCSQNIDLITDLVIKEDTLKYIGDYVDEMDEYYCRFFYKSSGELYYCEFNYMSEQDSELFHPSNIKLIRDKFVLTDEMYNYYLTTDFLPPII